MPSGVYPVVFGHLCHRPRFMRHGLATGQIPVCRGAYPPTATFAPKDVWLSVWQAGLGWFGVFHSGFWSSNSALSRPASADDS
jgi:hypothetical protein